LNRKFNFFVFWNFFYNFIDEKLRLVCLAYPYSDAFHPHGHEHKLASKNGNRHVVDVPLIKIKTLKSLIVTSLIPKKSPTYITIIHSYSLKIRRSYCKSKRKAIFQSWDVFTDHKYYRTVQFQFSAVAGRQM